jgi:predicted nuclease with TOPRIM domain
MNNTLKEHLSEGEQYDFKALETSNHPMDSKHKDRLREIAELRRRLSELYDKIDEVHELVFGEKNDD